MTKQITTTKVSNRSKDPCQTNEASVPRLIPRLLSKLVQVLFLDLLDSCQTDESSLVRRLMSKSCRSGPRFLSNWPTYPLSSLSCSPSCIGTERFTPTRSDTCDLLKRIPFKNSFFDYEQESFLLRTRKFDKKVEETTHVWKIESLQLRNVPKIAFCKISVFCKKHMQPVSAEKAETCLSCSTYLASSRIWGLERVTFWGCREEEDIHSRAINAGARYVYLLSLALALSIHNKL
jgi:hypothetical protein